MRKLRRARSAEEKADRTAALADAARELLAGEDYDSVSVEAIAKRAGVAKGTVFLYYPTKEALGLAVLGSLLEEWWADLHAKLDTLERPASPSSVAAAGRRSLEGRGDMLRLLGWMSSVLETRAGVEAVTAFRELLREGASRLGARLESALPFLRRGEGLEVALTLHALVIGVHQMSWNPRGLESEDLAPFRVDVPGAVGRTLRVQLEGARAVALIGAAPAS